MFIFLFNGCCDCKTINKTFGIQTPKFLIGDTVFHKISNRKALILEKSYSRRIQQWKYKIKLYIPIRIKRQYGVIVSQSYQTWYEAEITKQRRI